MQAEFAAENAVASSKNNAGTSELVFGDEILECLKVVGFQMIFVGLRLNKVVGKSFVRPRPCLWDGNSKREFWVLRMLLIDTIM